MPKHPENRGERNPLASRKLKRQLLKNRFVPNKKVPRANSEGEPVTSEQKPRVDSNLPPTNP